MGYHGNTAGSVNSSTRLTNVRRVLLNVELLSVSDEPIIRFLQLRYNPFLEQKGGEVGPTHRVMPGELREFPVLDWNARLLHACNHLQVSLLPMVQRLLESLPVAAVPPIETKAEQMEASRLKVDLELYTGNELDPTLLRCPLRGVEAGHRVVVCERKCVETFRVSERNQVFGRKGSVTNR